MNNFDKSVFPQVHSHSTEIIWQPVISTPQLSPVGTVAATLTIASAFSIGSNMVDVQNGGMTFPQAITNGVVKGVAASLILNVTARSTAIQVVFTAGVLATAGYLIDSAMKKNREEFCAVSQRDVR